MAEKDTTVIGEPQGETEITTGEIPKGRAGVMSKFRKANPDFEGEPTDEELWDYAGEDYDSLKDTHKKVMAGQQGLHDYVAKDPRFGAAIGMSFGEGEDKVPFTRALGRLYGPDAFSDDEELSKGFEEFNENLKKTRESAEEAQRNFDTLTAPRLEGFAKEKELTDEQLDSIFESLDEMATAMFMGDVPIGVIELVYKGLNYDMDIKEAADTGFVEGKGEAVRPALRKLTSDTPIPDMAGGTGAGKNKVHAKKRGGSYYDSMEEVKE